MLGINIYSPPLALSTPPVRFGPKQLGSLFPQCSSSIMLAMACGGTSAVAAGQGGRGGGGLETASDEVLPEHDGGEDEGEGEGEEGVYALVGVLGVRHRRCCWHMI